MTTSQSLVEQLLAQLQGAPLQQIAQQLGTDTAQTQSAVSAALPLLLGALGNNAAQPQGAMECTRPSGLALRISATTVMRTS